MHTSSVERFSENFDYKASFLSLECTDFKNIIVEKIPWAPSEVAEVAEVKRPQNPKRQKF